MTRTPKTLDALQYVVPEPQIRGMTVTVLEGQAATERWDEAVRQMRLLMWYCETTPGELQ